MTFVYLSCLIASAENQYAATTPVESIAAFEVSQPPAQDSAGDLGLDIERVRIDLQKREAEFLQQWSLAQPSFSTQYFPIRYCSCDQAGALGGGILKGVSTVIPAERAR
jgi:hypothetical protein